MIISADIGVKGRARAVEGWDAIPTKIPCQFGGRKHKTNPNKRYMLDSFCVRQCPEFEPDRDARMIK